MKIKPSLIAFSTLLQFPPASLFMLLFWLLGSMNPDLIYGQQPFFDSDYIEVQGIRYHFRHSPVHDSIRRGRILFLHGFACSTYSWRKVVPALEAAGYETLLVDTPPFGYSERPKHYNQSFSAQATALWELIGLISETDTGSWFVTGHSMGAATAGAMAAVAPKRTRGIIVVDGLVFNSGKGPLHSVQWLLRPPSIKWLTGMLGQWLVISRKRVKYVLRRAYGRQPTPEEVNAYLRPLKQKRTARGVVNMFAYSTPVFNYDTDSIHSPALIIWGERDLIPFREALALKNKLLDAQLVTIPEAAHCPMETHSDRFLELMMRFLENKNRATP